MSEEQHKEDIVEETTQDEQSDAVEEREDCENCAQYKDGWQRALADYNNLKAEGDAMRSEWAKMSKVQCIEEFLPVYDNLKKAFSAETGELTKEQENWVKGIEFIMKQFSDILETNGIEEIKTVGEAFDPALHEALSQEESEAHESNTIIKELDAGYKMGDKVLKPAKVIVST